MSSQVTTLFTVAAASRSPERGHHIRLLLGAATALAFICALTIYGADYYMLGVAARPLSPKHALLRPTGALGLKLGVLGFLLFLLIYLYPLRKRVSWLKRGSAKHWLDFHVLLGLTAPVIIAFHSSFKLHGLAGMAFWVMSAVAVSGVVGRYIYGQIPRSLNAAELSFKESLEIQEQLTAELLHQDVLSQAELEPLFRLPSPERVQQLPILAVLAQMLAWDAAKSLHIAALRRRGARRNGTWALLGGFVSTGDEELERVISVARKQAALSKRILFLSRTQQVFHLWHVIHRPFSYSFAILASLHILVALVFGFI